MVDFGQSADWTPALYDRLNSLKQGSIIEEINFAFLPDVEHPLWLGGREITEENSQGKKLAFVSESEITKGMLITQACDLVKNDNPWATIIPVYDLTNRLTANQLRNHSTNPKHHFQKLSAEWTTSGNWVADFRLEFPIEKTLLLEMNISEAFAHERDYAVLAEKLADRRRRPAIEKDVIDYFIEPFFTKLDGRLLEIDPAALAAIDHFRIQQKMNDDGSFTVNVYVLSKSPLREDSKSILDSIVNDMRMDCESHSIEIIGLDAMTWQEMTAEEYSTSVLMSTESS